MAQAALSNRYLPWRALTMRWRDATIAWRQHATTTSVYVTSAGDTRLMTWINTRYSWRDLTQRWRDYTQTWRAFTGAVWVGVQAAAGTCGHVRLSGYYAADCRMVRMLTAFRSRMGRSTQTWRI